MNYRQLNVIVYILATGVYLCLTCSTHLSAAENVPWTWNIKPGLSEQFMNEDPLETSVPGIAAKAAIVFFQRYISPADGPRCNFYPSCAEYCKSAIQKHGFIKGIILFEDRFMRDHGFGFDYYPEVWVGNQFLYFDPVFMNDFWWHDTFQKESREK